jgi:hypothetical protein
MKSWRDRFADYFLVGNRVAYVAGAMAGLTAMLFVVGVVQVSRQRFRVLPDRRLTPGAALQLTQTQVCELAPSTAVIPVDVGVQVFDHYGIERPGAREYELDLLIPANLGGADNPKNYWPQPFDNSEWNAQVKDALEAHLQKLVCANKLDLATAQGDLSSDWIEAYKKYFKTQGPLAPHRTFKKDAPWEP